MISLLQSYNFFLEFIDSSLAFKLSLGFGTILWSDVAALTFAKLN